MEVKPGYKQTEVGVIPEEWGVGRLGSIAALERGKFTARPRNQPKFFGGDIPFIQTGDITNSNGHITRYAQTLNHEGLRVSKLFPRETLFFTIAANIGDVGIAALETAATDSVIAISPRDGVEKCWLYHSLRWQKEKFQGLATQNAQANINLEKLRPYLLAVPPLPEQRAIATALSDVDALLGSLDRLIAKKRDLQQAAMQQLLTGQTRLPGFTGEWEVRELREVCTKIQDGTHFSPKLGGNDYLYVTSKNIGFGTLDVSDADMIDAAEHAKIYRRCDVKKGDLLLTKDGANTGNCAINSLDEPFSLLSSVAFLRFDVQFHVPAFFLYQILSPEGQRRITDLMSGNAITRLTLAKIKSLRFAVASIEEQTAIAEVLMDMDAGLATLERRREKTRALKQAMMQELLTGRTRLVDGGASVIQPPFDWPRRGRM
jgi:type I restriction enzyme S subunit